MTTQLPSTLHTPKLSPSSRCFHFQGAPCALPSNLKLFRGVWNLLSHRCQGAPGSSLGRTKRMGRMRGNVHSRMCREANTRCGIRFDGILGQVATERGRARGTWRSSTDNVLPLDMTQQHLTSWSFSRPSREGGSGGAICCWLDLPAARRYLAEPSRSAKRRHS